MVSARDADDRPQAAVPEEKPKSPDTEKHDPLTETEGLDLVGILSSVEETAYVWDLRTGRLDWESNATEILDVADLSKISTGAAYHALIAPEHLNVRLEVFSRSVGADRERGVPYRIQYRLRPGGLRSGKEVRLEDQGRWWPGADGHPQRARGVVRIVDDHYLEQQRRLVRNDLDELTGQLNRMRLTEALGAVLSRTEREKRSCAFLMISVNNLAVINETFGLEVGDEVIAEVGRRIRARLRGGDVIGRYSANKFGIVLMNCGAGAVATAAERFINAVRDTTIKTSAAQLSATVSLGGVIIPDQANSVHDAVNFALRTLDIAKSKRFDCFVLYEPSPSGESARLRNKTIAESVVNALDENRMRLVLQPMVSTKTGKAEVYEALLRMVRHDGSLVAAGEFVPIAEQLGLARLIDRRTLELTVDLLKQHPELILSVNVSGLTCSDKEWLTTLRRVTAGDPGVLSRMIVEITETVALHELDQSVNFVNTLKELGCRVAIDDFGAGYTSFKNLKLLNVDMVKIDGAFVKNVANDTSDQIFVKTMIELARTFGMETVAEWVGDERSAKYLTDAGITYMQGYYYGMPFDSSDYVKAA
ncbi:bifunctional diguanylate cyclase/phosphodiesterase [Hyphomicrobium sp. ghe19]|uniref:bifunctional diguanylate cyclase/phosphodiesterase n=1 Tax=Hyphomicrobium sp. ghe19 TaxID=2682968 RepID=UPI00136732D9|nr:Cyclic di-GMP phosphodiesterase PdeB [Hyphomicrobium sp. ghe19]